ncbi:T9SS type A sorting domain-containing protein [Ancylomarina sp. 16SWW S1-10-2]|uniref:T9SS type A sorting domain-containing protein n=1 Tax=Ancylomarina sp. 16SWW S1-10-2 TaxID=2499681 RepID=UPI0012AD3133|nr:T9SS type A sorting domain-containing protein [Ancylomarina sp. 16SWW S1-10-2]MRT92014.1 T9SS type A sorting domain-containing protein [Ancylomarina sp. 16SWW S1-10-2]
MSKIVFLLFIFAFFIGEIKAVEPDDIIIDVNLNTKRSLGNVSSFDRNKFVAIHADVKENEWDGDNFTSDLRDHFLNGYDVYLGRNTGTIGWNMNNVVTEDPDRTGYADPASILSSGESSKTNYANVTAHHAYENRNDQILCAQLHPFWPDGQETKKGWSFSLTDTEAEPFGTASGEYMGRYIHDHYGSGGTTGKPEPKYVEVINEPLYWLVDHGSDQPEKVFKFHNAVADQIRKYNPDSDIQIGGFCVAFPDFEKNDFKQWEERSKLFMDICGAKMDYWTIHLYDFAAKGGKEMYRKGSNMEATFDMMEQYSYLSFGEVKPFMISEFGAVSHDLKGAWSPLRDWHHMKSVNSMRMQFMERADIINKTIDFLPIKATWGTTDVNNTYSHRLMRKENEPNSYTGDWVYTEMVKVYQLWSDVKGTRVDSKSTNLDVMTDVYVDGNKAYVILNNLEFNSVNVTMNVLGANQDLQSLKIKKLYLEGNKPVLDESVLSVDPKEFTIGAEGTMILEYTYASSIDIDETSSEFKYYANTYFKPIVANTPEVFTISGVEFGMYGEAILRLGIGRAHGKSLHPKVLVNGAEIEVPTNFRGGSQTQRESFFGVLEIPVPYELIKSNNSISVAFTESGGHISSLALKTNEFSKEITRTENVSVGISDVSPLGSQENSNLKLYPNPVSSILNVDTGESNDFSNWEVVSLNGKVVLQAEISNSLSKLQLNVSSLSRGYYILRLRGSDFQSVPFVKQ